MTFIPLDANLRPFEPPHRLLMKKAYDTRMPLPTRMTFIPLREPTSAPSGHLLPWEGGRVPLHELHMKMAFDTRIPLPRICHFERKREIFFVRGKTKAVRGTASRKHPAPCTPKKRCFMQTAPRRKKNTANEKDPSAPLGMTIRETAFLIFPFIPRREPTSAPSGHLLPWEGGRMPPHRLLMKMAYDTRIPLPRIRHFERKREIFFVRGKEKDVRGAASGKHPAPCAPKKTVFHADRSTQEKEHGKQKRSLGCARDDDTRILSSKKRQRSRHLNPEP